MSTTARDTAAATSRVVVFDLSALTYRFGPRRKSVSVWAGGEHLHTCAISPTSSHADAALEVTRSAARTARVLRPAAPRRPDEPALEAAAVGFYNPFSAQVSLDVDGQPGVYDCPHPLRMGHNGLTLTCDGEQLLEASGHVAGVRTNEPHRRLVPCLAS